MKVRALPVTDSVTRDGETVVMSGDRVILLSPMASAALALLTEPLDVSEVASALVRQFGEAPGIDVGEATRQLLEGLADAELVRLED
jgi:hypothetical protein